MKRLNTLLFALAAVYLCSHADSREDIRNNPLLSGSNYTVYQDQNLPELTPAPDGYEPFYISTYARHGSRWLCDMFEYDAPIKPLEKAAEAGKLTPLGRQTLDDLNKVRDNARYHCGDLTDVGAEQHQRIARRMLQNFPEIFSGNGKTIDAKSSTVVRCVLSMLNEIKEIQGYNPFLEINADASQADLWWVAWGANRKLSKLRSDAKKEMTPFKVANVDPSRFMNSLIADLDYARDSIDAYQLMRDLFMVTTIQQSHKDGHNFYPLFTNDELYHLWEGENAQHYVEYGYAPQSGFVMPFAEVQLLKDFIDRTDAALLTFEPSAEDATMQHVADLRFGHEVILIALTTIMELGDYGAVIPNLEDVASQWENYKIFPMASNIQWILYRPKGDNDKPILIKAMLNEHEMKLPVETDSYPYYEWDKLRTYYLDKLWDFITKHPDLVSTGFE